MELEVPPALSPFSNFSGTKCLHDLLPTLQGCPPAPGPTSGAFSGANEAVSSLCSSWEV